MGEATKRKIELGAADEKKIKDAVVAAEIGGDDDYFEKGVRYGRKLVKKEKGMRSSSPPLAGLDKDDAAKIADALGIAPEAKSTEPAAMDEDLNAEAGKKAKPDPKPGGKKRRQKTAAS